VNSTFRNIEASLAEGPTAKKVLASCFVIAINGGMIALSNQSRQR
jgi:hypothetical protein